MNSSNVAIAEINDLIVVKQLPVIEEQLKTIKVNIEEKVSGVLALECTEGTVKAIKVLRADLTKDFKELEERRKLVKSKILAPYEAFETIYKECVTDIFKSADTELKKRIDDVENKLKYEKRKEIEDYFNEYAKSKNIDFIGFFDTNINVTMSASKKSLMEQAKAFIDKICDDLKLIDTQEHKEEILVEYKATLNVSNAITSVCERHKAIEKEKAKQEIAEQINREQTEVIEKVNAARNDAEPLSAPKEVSDDDILCKMTFTVAHKKSKMKELKTYIIDNGFEIVK